MGAPNDGLPPFTPAPPPSLPLPAAPPSLTLPSSHPPSLPLVSCRCLPCWSTCAPMPPTVQTPAPASSTPASPSSRYACIESAAEVDIAYTQQRTDPPGTTYHPAPEARGGCVLRPLPLSQTPLLLLLRSLPLLPSLPLLSQSLQQSFPALAPRFLAFLAKLLRSAKVTMTDYMRPPIGHQRPNAIPSSHSVLFDTYDSEVWTV